MGNGRVTWQGEELVIHLRSRDLSNILRRRHTSSIAILRVRRSWTIRTMCRLKRWC